MKGKHSKKTENEKFYIFVYLLIIFLILAIILFGYKYFNTEKKARIQEKEVIHISEVNNEITKENEKLVLKSNFEENREKKIIYTFDENILLEVSVLETYINQEEYNIQKHNSTKNTNIEIIEFNDSDFKIYYKRLNLGTDEGLSYQEIYDKYIGIIGAYEIISE